MAEGALHYYELTENPFEEVAKRFGRDQKSFDEDVKTIEDWIKSQPHLPEVLDAKYIRNFLASCKFSIEKVKRCIDNYYTLRGALPDIFDLCDINNEEFKQSVAAIYHMPVPKPTKEGYRLFFRKIRDHEGAEKINVCALAAQMVLDQEMRLNEDCMIGDVVVLDFKDVTLSHLMKITPTSSAKVLAIYEKIYSNPLKAVYIINSPPIVDVFLNVLKSLMKEKLFKRITVCPDTSILLKMLPKEIIPKDYGGDERSLEELHVLWQKKLKEYQGRFEQLKKFKVDESLRPEKLDNDEILGFHGNFKKLTVD